MNSPDNNFKKILKEIRLYENGPAVDGMERLGLHYHKNFGVSLINLKGIAKKYYPDHDLANLLRKKDFRETKILSLMIEDLQTLTQKDIQQIIKQISTQELAEQTVINIFEKDRKYFQKALQLINSDKEFEITTGFILFSRVADTNEDLENSFFENFFKRAVELSDIDSINIRKSVARAFRQTALRNNYLKEKVLEVMETIKNKDSRNAEIVYEEVVPLINF